MKDTNFQAEHSEVKSLWFGYGEAGLSGQSQE